MTDLKRMFQEYVDLSEEELLERAQADLRFLMPVLEKVGGENASIATVLTAVALAIAADGKLSGREAQFAELLFDLSAEETYMLAQAAADADALQRIDELFPAGETLMRARMLDLCLCFAAADGSIPPEEQAFLLRLAS